MSQIGERLPTKKEVMAVAEFVRSLDVDPGEIQRGILHWTAGGAFPNSVDLKPYHALADQEARLHRGKYLPEANENTADGEYSPHTLHTNTKSFGGSLCGMRGAKESPLDVGPSPINEEQFIAMACVFAWVLRNAALPVERHTCLTHAEVQSTLGIKQRNKWDITILPWRNDITGAHQVGDYFRRCVRAATEHIAPGSPVAHRHDAPQTLRMGARGPLVETLQRELDARGYHLGRPDGHFGSLARAAVLAFQADHGLAADGVAGPATWAALRDAPEKEDRTISEDDLRQSGSATIQAADRAETAAKLGGGGIAALASLEALNGLSDVVEEASGTLPAIQALVVDNWAALLVIGAGAGIWYFGVKDARLRRFLRLKDAAEGKHLGR